MGEPAELVVPFPCGGEQLLGILARGREGARLGVLIVVGGPQYRVGSHRQFVLLARALAAAGHPAMRFDYRGMGDSPGAQRAFDEAGDDIAAAIAAFRESCPGLERVVLWGLCDAASASLLYWYERRDPQVAGLCLLNPWVRSAQTLARTQVKHYYGRRLLQGEFWRKLLSGRLDVAAALGGLLAKLRVMRRAGESPVSGRPFQWRMAEAMRSFPGPLLLLLSGDDYTAKEFLELAGSDGAWSGLLAQANVRRVDLAEADHTFSSAHFRGQAERAVLDWLERCSEEAAAAANSRGKICR